MKFKLTRNIPQHIEIEVLANQLISMFPIEVQHHPFFGNIRRVWRSGSVEYSVDNFNDEDKEVIGTGKHIKLKDDVMLKILQNIENFHIVLYYSDSKDTYEVRRV